ncbi:WD40-repeat-containing domain protein [Phascolomyces articulosus]|uniref:WD40-repeat-containing domain protein n=1 Tax=Phascolomyces articulosus TaxID=60185 RepID=A0AAD5K0Z2_9FUNG|nr:WD40-repeat-containing domain protein [Phascolomyces articulosus]
MNLELLDPWEQEYPQIIEETLEDGYVLNCKFNRRGTLLAAGTHDGRCVVWDFDTKGIARNLLGHIKPVASVSWSRNGRYLLSASKDWTCIVWNLVTGEKYTRVRFPVALMMAHMHPKNNFIFAAALQQSNPVVVDVSNGKTRITRLLTDTPEYEGKFFISAISWNKTGSRIYAGSSKGHLFIIDGESYKTVYSERITNTTIKEIQWSRNGKDILINGNDRVMRYYQLEDHDGVPTLKNKFQDLVNRIQWNSACFSADGEFVIGGSGHKAEHNIYIWDKNIGNLVKILEGPKEPLDDLSWHPIRPVIASVSSYGNIYLWTTKHEENWSAFAPDFTELEENLEYEEQEDEFDVIPAEEVSRRKEDDEDTIVDVTTVENVQAFVDSDDEEMDSDEVYYLPPIAEASDDDEDEDDRHDEEMGGGGHTIDHSDRDMRDVAP